MEAKSVTLRDIRALRIACACVTKCASPFCLIAPIDVVFVLDCSSSVRRGLDQLRQFVTSVVEYLMAGQEGAHMNTRIGIIVYAKRVYKLFELGDPNCSSLDEMLRKIQDIAVVGGALRYFSCGDFLTENKLRVPCQLFFLPLLTI